MVRTEGVFDERSRVLYLVAEVSDPYNQQSSNWQEPLRVGTFVDARIEGETLLNVVRLPRSVLQKDNTVWTVDSERTLHPVKVEIVQSDETSVLVSADVIAGKLICKTYWTIRCRALPFNSAHLCR